MQWTGVFTEAANNVCSKLDFVSRGRQTTDASSLSTFVYNFNQLDEFLLQALLLQYFGI